MTYFVGIDIAKFKHDCFIQDHNGVVIRHSFSFRNNQDGFNVLLDALNGLDHSQEIKIGLEATGHYGSNIKQFLNSNDYSFMEFNPLLIKRFSQATTLRKTKTDKIDAALISSFLMTVDYKPITHTSYHTSALKSLTRLRESLVKERSQTLISITNVLDIIFPEFKPLFDNSLKSSTCMYILENYSSPDRISRMNVESYNKMKSKLRKTISYDKFLKIRDAAKSTVGTADEIYVYELQILLGIYKELDSRISDLENKIIQYYRQFNSHIHTIKGVSELSAAAIYAELNGVTGFRNPDQILAFAGLDCSRIQSGESDKNGRMVKHGSSALRCVLMRCADSFALHNPVVYEYKMKKMNEGKFFRVALSHVAKKLVRTIYTLEKNDLDFDQSKLR